MRTAPRNKVPQTVAELSPMAVRMLEHLRKPGPAERGMRQMELAEALDVTDSYVYKTLRDLEGVGLVVRGADRRYRPVSQRVPVQLKVKAGAKAATEVVSRILLPEPVPVVRLWFLVDLLESLYGPGLTMREEPKGWLCFERQTQLRQVEGGHR